MCRCVMTLKVCMCLQAQRCRVEQSRVISLQRKARICTAAGTKSERVRERVTNRQRERGRESETGLSSCMCEDAANMLQDIGAKRSAVMSQKKQDYQSMKHEACFASKV